PGASLGRAFVTGASGFLGYEIARQLAKAGVVTRALSRTGSLPGELADLGVTIVRGDLSNPLALREGMTGCDVVFHVAADVTMWRRRWTQSVSTNVIGTRNVVAESTRTGIRRLVHTSTAATIGKPLIRCATEPVMVDERSAYNFHELAMVYPHTKWLAEQEVRRGIAEGLDAVVTHPAAIFGPRDWKHNTLPLLQAPKRKLAFAAPGGTRSICDVRDVATAHLRAAELAPAGAHYILGGDCLSLSELLGLIAQLVGGSPPRLELPDRWVRALGTTLDVMADLTGKPPLLSSEMATQSTFRVRLSSAKAEAQLGYRSRPPRESLRDAVAWFRQRGVL
ncbi:MAG: NAD-dependent dehydratase, partial [Deltaproteobacteria bacterium]